MTTKGDDKDGLLDELSSIKYQLNGGPEHQPSIPQLDMQSPPVAKKSGEQSPEQQDDLETLIEELEERHLPKLERQLRPTIDDT